MRSTISKRLGAWLLLVAGLGASCSSDESGNSGARNTGSGGGNDPFGNATAGMSGAAGGGAGSFGNTMSMGGPTSGTGGGEPVTSTEGRSCADAQVKTSKVKPIIAIVLDGSGSMCADYGGMTRWQSLRSALLDPADGLIKRLETAVEFGMTLYDGSINPLLAVLGNSSSENPGCAEMYLFPKAVGDCPQLIEVAPAIMNFAPIDAAFPQTELGGSTPTDKALTHVMDQMTMAAMAEPDPMNHPRYVILATDGEPNDICAMGVGGDGSVNKMNVIAQVERGVMAGVKTYVISLAGDSMTLQMHLDQVAAAGGTGTMAFSPMTKDDLVATLGMIIGGAIGCQVFLNGEVTAGMECMGYVELNGKFITCNDPDGWRLLDSKTIELQGKACEEFMSSPDVVLNAGFPCGVFRPT
jgi:hypothetical protein